MERDRQKERENQAEASETLMTHPQKPHSITSATFPWSSRHEDLPRERGDDRDSISWWEHGKILEEHMGLEILLSAFLESTIYHTLLTRLHPTVSSSWSEFLWTNTLVTNPSAYLWLMDFDAGKCHPESLWDTWITAEPPEFRVTHGCYSVAHHLELRELGRHLGSQWILPQSNSMALGSPWVVDSSCKNRSLTYILPGTNLWLDWYKRDSTKSQQLPQRHFPLCGSLPGLYMPFFPCGNRRNQRPANHGCLA